VSDQDADFSLDTFNEQASEHIRHVMHEGENWYSVIDVVALLTGTERPRKYWSDMKHNIDDGSFIELSEKCLQLKMPALDGRMRITDCANAETMRAICRFIPAAAPWRSKSKPDGIVYAIGLSDGRMVKIGTTTDLVRRLSTLCSSSPVPLVVLWQMPGDGELEHRLHTHFAHRRAYGEWFSFAGANVLTELQAAIAEIGQAM